MVEVRQFHQYVVKVDGSGRLTLRNRQHLRKYTPLHHHDDRESIIESILPPVEDPHGQQIETESITPSSADPSRADLSHADPSRAEPSHTDQACTNPSNNDMIQTSQPNLPSNHIEHEANVTPHSTNPDESARHRNNLNAQPTLRQEPATIPKKLPRALAPLQPHNMPGVSELAPLRRLRNRANIE